MVPPPGFELYCRRCWALIPPEVNASACDDCSYTVCTGCVSPGVAVKCSDCPVSVTRRRRCAAGSRSPSSARADTDTLEAALAAGADWGPHWVVPSSVTLTFKRGPLVLRPTLAVPRARWDSADTLERAVLSLLATAPVSTAAGRRSAVARFSSFLSEVKGGLPIADVSQRTVAEFVVWRVALVPGVPPPEGRGPVEPATVLADLAHIRAHATLADAEYLPRLYGSEITAVLRRLGAAERPDGVRKTPVCLEQVRRVARQAADSEDVVLARRALAVVLGFFMFMRNGEFAHIRGSHLRLLQSPTAVALTLVRTKTRSPIARLAVTRICQAPLLLQTVARFTKLCPVKDDELVFPDFSTESVRALLRDLLGKPPLLPGESQALPWSLRAGAATQCFLSGMDPERIMRLGRWSSRVALLYCVLTPQVQAASWSQRCQPDWWRD